MIIYFADRHMTVLGSATTGLPKGFTAISDKKIEDVDTGVASFECTISFEKEEQLSLQEVTEAGNYILRKHENENEFYTIIEAELDIEKQEVYIYAEDAGLDLLNEIALPYEATEAHDIVWYIEKWAEDSGFEIGINEIPDLTRKLVWEGEATVTERLASVATQFDNAEISYSFDVDGMQVLHKYINIHKKRGKDIGEELRINKNLNNITIKSSVANLATALYVTGGTPEGQEDPITLAGYSYDDGDMYVDGAYLKSRNAVAKWSRYLSESGTGEGHIVRTYSYDTTNKQTLCAHAVTELKQICEPEINYEVDIAILPENIKIGDRVNLVDDNGETYLSARVLKLEQSVTEKTQKATLGEYLIRDSGISEQVEALAAQFAEIAKNRVLYTWIAYADDALGTNISLDPTGKAYMGISANRKSPEPDLSDPTQYKWSKVEGGPGRSLQSITEHYLISALTQGVTTETEGWSTSIPIMTPEKPYLWNYETLTYSDGSVENLDPKVIGSLGEPGDDAPYVINMSEEYYLSVSETELSGGEWVRTMPKWLPGKYLWTRWCIEWSEPNPTTLTYSEPVIAAAFNDICETADSAKTAAEEAKTEAESATSQVSQVNTELAQAQQELEALADNLDTLESDMATNYATKGELTQVNSSLGTLIEQNAAQISQTATQVTEIEIDASQALQDAADAAAAAETAKQNAIDAQNKYTQLQQQANATDEQLEAAQEAVEQAMQEATAAGDLAAAAQSAVGSLTDRVTAAETNITQNANQISQTAEKIDNLKIGGRNLLKYTGNMPIDSEANGTDGISRYNNSYGTLTDTGDGLKLTFASHVNACMSVPLIDDGVVENGEEVTLSFKYRGNITNPGAFFFLQRTTPNIAVTTLPVNYPLEVSETEWKEYAATFSHNEANIRTCYQVLLFQGLSGYDNTNWVEIKKNTLKLEKGNRATDWTPATEDQAEDITSAIEEASSQILQTAEEITMGILSGYTTESDLAEYKQEIQNLLSVTSEGFSFEFSQIEQKITQLGDDIVEKNQFIRLENGNIIIGKSDSPIQAKFTNNALEFMYNDVTVAKFTNEVLEVRNIKTQNQVAFGDNWAIRPGTGNNLNVVWTGG